MIETKQRLVQSLSCFLIGLGCALLFIETPTALANYEVGRGMVLRYYEERSSEWASYVLLKDPLGQEQKYYVHPTLTLVKRGPQVEKIENMTGGDHVVILFRPGEGKARASVIQIEDFASVQ